jgi:hypothetical protein
MWRAIERHAAERDASSMVESARQAWEYFKDREEETMKRLFALILAAIALVCLACFGEPVPAQTWRSTASGRRSRKIADE